MTNERKRHKDTGDSETTGPDRDIRSGQDEPLIQPADIRRRIAGYDREIDRLQKALEDAKERRSGLRITLEEYNLQERADPLAATPEDLDAIRGQSLRQALIILAERHNNVLDSTAARRALEAAGVVESPMKPNHLYRELKLLSRFKQTARGKYKLLPPEPEDRSLF